MRQDLPVSSSFQDASFALFEGLRGAQQLSLDIAGEARATWLCTIDPATRGLAFTSAGDAALELQLEGAGRQHVAWVHAAYEARGPQLSVYLETRRPALQLHFAPPSLLALEDQRYLLRERPTLPSHDGAIEERKLLVGALARAFRIPYVGGWLHLGCWDGLDRSWQPETARRVLGAALLLERARTAVFTREEI